LESSIKPLRVSQWKKHLSQLKKLGSVRYSVCGFIFWGNDSLPVTGDDYPEGGLQDPDSVPEWHGDDENQYDITWFQTPHPSNRIHDESVTYRKALSLYIDSKSGYLQIPNRAKMKEKRNKIRFLLSLFFNRVNRYVTAKGEKKATVRLMPDYSADEIVSRLGVF